MNHSNQETLHQQTINLTQTYLKYEVSLLDIIQQLDQAKTYYYFNEPSLFCYLKKYTKLSETKLLTLINVARKSLEYPELKSALAENTITLSNARRIAPILNPDNKIEWIQKAATLSLAKLEQALAEKFPGRPAPTKIRPKSKELVRLEVDISNQCLNHLKQAQAILNQKKQKYTQLGEVLEAVLAEYIYRNDPIRKAERAQKPKNNATALVAKPLAQQKNKMHLFYKSKNQAPTIFQKTSRKFFIKYPKRKHLQAWIRHLVRLRDLNQCTALTSDGKRCSNRFWLDVHHKKAINQGGTNDLNNLQLLCSAHHRLLHRTKSQSNKRYYNGGIGTQTKG